MLINITSIQLRIQMDQVFIDFFAIYTIYTASILLVDQGMRNSHMNIKTLVKVFDFDLN